MTVSLSAAPDAGGNRSHPHGQSIGDPLWQILLPNPLLRDPDRVSDLPERDGLGISIQYHVAAARIAVARLSYAAHIDQVAQPRIDRHGLRRFLDNTTGLQTAG